MTYRSSLLLPDFLFLSNYSTADHRMVLKKKETSFKTFNHRLARYRFKSKLPTSLIIYRRFIVIEIIAKEVIYLSHNKQGSKSMCTVLIFRFYYFFSWKQDLVLLHRRYPNKSKKNLHKLCMNRAISQPCKSRPNLRCFPNIDGFRSNSWWIPFIFVSCSSHFPQNFGGVTRGHWRWSS